MRTSVTDSDGPGEVEISGARLAYDSAGGEEPAAVFVHAAIADRRMWGRQFSSLGHERRLVRLDLRGYGGSTPRLRSVFVRR